MYFENIVCVMGSNGQIGIPLSLHLASLSILGSASVITADKRDPVEALQSFPFIQCDATNFDSFSEILSSYHVSVLYNLPCILSATGEKDPLAAWGLNMAVILNGLELAKASHLQLFWPSSIAVCGAVTPKNPMFQHVSLDPSSMYGVCKVAGESLGNYYFHKFGVDVRSVRYPGLLSSETDPGGGTTDYAVDIFYKALQTGSYTCYLREDTLLPMMYMPDAINAATLLMNAPFDQVKIRTSYNLGAFSFTPRQLGEAIARYVPGFTCHYEVDPLRQAIADSWPGFIDDREARDDFGWQPQWTFEAMVYDMLTKVRERLNRYCTVA